MYAAGPRAREAEGSLRPTGGAGIPGGEGGPAPLAYPPPLSRPLPFPASLGPPFHAAGPGGMQTFIKVDWSYTLQSFPSNLSSCPGTPPTLPGLKGEGDPSGGGVWGTPQAGGGVY